MEKKRNSSRRRGFTLIELIAVVVVLAILAGVALPRYFDHAANAREAATKGALGSVRAGIANFYANAAISGDPAYPTFGQLATLGTVVQEPLPVNPYNNSSDVRDADGLWVAGNPPVSGSKGWAYDATNGKFWANSSTIGENSW